MKNVVRTLTLALTVTGMAAVAQVSSSSSSKILTGKVDFVPVPCCAPNDPDACGIGKR